MEKGWNNPSLELAHRVVKVFGTGMEEVFLFGEGKKWKRG